MSTLSMMREWKAEGRAEGMAEGMALGMLEARRTDLTKVLRLRFPDAPYELTALVRGMTDVDQLGRWLDVAVTAPSVDLFRIMVVDADDRARRKQGS